MRIWCAYAATCRRGGCSVHNYLVTQYQIIGFAPDWPIRDWVVRFENLVGECELTDAPRRRLDVTKFGPQCIW